MGLRVFLCVGIFLFGGARLWLDAQDSSLKKSLSFGLEREIFFVSPEAHGFLAYRGFDSSLGVSPPFVSRIVGESAIKDQDLFFHETWIRLPPGLSIQSVTNETGSEVWVIPLGTEILDLIRLRNEKKSIFELRRMKQIEKGWWAMGLYKPISSAVFHLVDNGGDQAKVVYKTAGQSIELMITRIHPDRCVYCHDTEERVGFPEPYGFAPRNRINIEEWISEFERRFGRSPITKPGTTFIPKK